MSTRLNNAVMASTTGGTSDLELTSVPARPTFNQSLNVSAGTFPDFKYAIVNQSTGAYEYGVGTYNADDVALMNRTPSESWDGVGNVGAALIDFPVGTSVVVYCPITHQDLINIEEIDEILAEENSIPVASVEGLEETLQSKAQETHEHEPNQIKVPEDAPEGSYFDRDGNFTVPAGTSILGASDFTANGVPTQGQLLGITASGGVTNIGGLASTHLIDSTPDTLANNQYYRRVAGTIVGAGDSDIQTSAKTNVKSITFAFSSNGTYPVLPSAPHGYTITRLHHGKVGSGSGSLAVQIGGVSVGGLSSISPATFTMPFANTASTGNNTVVANNTVSVVVSGVTGTVLLVGQLDFVPVN